MAMAIAAAAITAAGGTALAKSGLPRLLAGHHKTHATAPAGQRTPAPGTTPGPGR
jgi:hypothetical protein